MHGDEPGSRMLLPMLAEWLCSKQTTDARAARIVNGMHLVSLPWYRAQQALGVRRQTVPWKRTGCGAQAAGPTLQFYCTWQAELCSWRFYRLEGAVMLGTDLAYV